MADQSTIDIGALAWDKQDGLLPAIVQDAAVMSRLALARVVARLSGEPVVDREILLEPQLRVRLSTAPPA